MSRQNKVNPGMYTQRGRLTQDDAARELRKQSSIGSQNIWQPMKKNAMPHFGPADASKRDAETSEDNADLDATPVAAETQTVSRATKRDTARKAAPVKARTKASKATAAKTLKAKKTGRKAKTGKVTKTGGEANGDHAQAKSSAGPERRRRWTKAASGRATPKELTALRPRNVRMTTLQEW